MPGAIWFPIGAALEVVALRTGIVLAGDLPKVSRDIGSWSGWNAGCTEGPAKVWGGRWQNKREYGHDKTRRGRSSALFGMR